MRPHCSSSFFAVRKIRGKGERKRDGRTGREKQERKEEIVMGRLYGIKSDSRKWGTTAQVQRFFLLLLLLLMFQFECCLSLSLSLSLSPSSGRENKLLPPFIWVLFSHSSFDARLLFPERSSPSEKTRLFELSARSHSFSPSPPFSIP